jgi:hypothetical protein
MSKTYVSASENFSACSYRVTMGGKKKFTPEGSRPGGEPWWYPDFLPRLDPLRAPCRFASLLQQKHPNNAPAFRCKTTNQISSCPSSQTTRALEFRKQDDRNLLIANHLDQTIYLANQEWVLDRAAAFASPQAYCAKMMSQSHFTEPVKQKIY